VVDDEAPMRRLIASNLKVSGYDVHTAADGTEALKLIAEHPFDLLLLDISLPGPDGLQVLDAIRRDLQTPVMMLSGRGRGHDRVGGGPGGGGVAYVCTVVQRIRRKREPDRHHPRYLLTEVGVGYLMPAADA